MALFAMFLSRRLGAVARFGLAAAGFDQLVQLAAVQPHAAALGTIIYLDTLTLGHG